MFVTFFMRKAILGIALLGLSLTCAVAKKVGEQASPDISNPSENRRGNVNDSPRGPKGSPSGPKRNPVGERDAAPPKPPVKTPPVTAPAIPGPSMDAKALVDSFSLLAENLSTKYQDTMTPETRTSKYIGGVGAAIEAVQWSKDLNTVFKAQDAINQFQRNMKAGETAYVLVSASPEGKVSVLRLDKPEAPVVSDGKQNSFVTKIVVPEFTSQQLMTPPEDREKALKDFYDAADTGQKEIINRERRRLGLPPMDIGNGKMQEFKRTGGIPNLRRVPLK